MRFIQTFDPTATASGTINIGTGDPGQKVLIYNESAVTIAINFENGYTAYVHAWEANYWTINIPTYEIEWSAVRNLTGAGQAPANYVDVFVYGANEVVEGTYPVQLARLVSTGNIVAVASTGTNIINDGNAASSQVIEATQSGSSGSNVSLDNSGNMALKQFVAAALTTIFQTIAGAAGGASNVKLSDASHQCEIIGNLLCDLALSVSGNTTLSGTLGVTGASTFTGAATFNGAGIGVTVTNELSVGGNILCTAPAANSSQYQAVNTSGVVKDILYINSANNLCLQSPIAGKVFIRDSSGANLFSVDSSGNVRAKGTVTASVTP